MERMSYGNTPSFTVTDRVSTTLTEYALEVAKAGRTALVDVPTLDEGGTTGRVRLLLCPGTQLSSQAMSVGAKTPRESVFLEDLDHQILLMHEPPNTPVDVLADAGGSAWLYDWAGDE